MLTLNYKRAGIVHVGIVLLLIAALTSPALARKNRSRSRRNRTKTKQVSRSTNSPSKQAARLGRSRSMAITPPRADAARPSRDSKKRDRRSLNAKRNTRGRRATRSSFETTRTARRSLAATRQARGTFNARKHARGSFNARKHAAGSYDAGKIASISPKRSPRVARDVTRDTSRFTTDRSRNNITRQRAVAASTSVLSPRRSRLDSRRVSSRNLRHRRNRRSHRRSRIYNRVVWPDYRFLVSYSNGLGFRFNYVYPYHHRKYLFVSLGGYWPDYSYARYYWYGWHPYNWYGYSPDAYEIKGDTYNYYTYNYDSGDQAQEQIDEGTLDKFQSQAPTEPAEPTGADLRFEEAVQAFENNNYSQAVDKLAEAVALEPDDIVLPFAYVQALFADEQYENAARTLRKALSKLPSDKEGLFFPRGLYSNDEILFDQIDKLAKKTERNLHNNDMQLLLAYQLIGVEKYDEAARPLRFAVTDAANAQASEMLLRLLEKMQNK